VGAFGNLSPNAINLHLHPAEKVAALLPRNSIFAALNNAFAFVKRVPILPIQRVCFNGN
jgi:hypothetical protein